MNQNDYLHAILKLATTISSSLKPLVVLQKITAQTARTMLCKASTLRLFDRTGTILLASAAYGLSPNYMRKGSIELLKSSMGTKVLAGKITHLRDACSGGRFQYPASAKAEGLAFVLSAPLVILGKSIGILRVYSKVKRALRG